MMAIETTAAGSSIEGLQQHDAAKGFDGDIKALMGINNFERMVGFQDRIVTEHKANVFDIIIGDDVSGRMPTLITHHILKRAFETSQIESRPRTLFIASGCISWNKPEDEDSNPTNKEWESNIDDYITNRQRNQPFYKALLITEYSSTGRSLLRMRNALERNDVTVQEAILGSTLYWLAGNSGSQHKKLRHAVGVEKYPPNALSQINPDSNQADINLLRSFIKDYADTVYDEIF